MQGPPTSFLADCKGLIAETVGLWFSEDRTTEFSRGVDRTCKDLGVTEDQLWDSLSAGDRDTVITLTENLTIGETYFYRDDPFFNLLEEKIVSRDFPAASVEAKRLRIWSAGCSTGEEPYSLAIALRRCLLGLDNWDVSVLATDLNTQSLAKAESGKFGNWSFRSGHKWLREQYFTETEDKKMEVLPFVKRLVKFSALNLAKDHFPSAFNATKDMDLIVCRNCLMYLKPESAAEAVRKFYEALVPGGYLVLSPVDGGLVGDLPLEPEDAGFYRKPGDDASRVTFTFEVQEPEPLSEEPDELEKKAADFDRARRLLAGGFWEPAEVLLRPLSEGEPDNSQMALMLSYSLAQQSRYDDAIESLVAQIGTGHASSELYRLLAACYYLQGDSKRAEEQLRKALYLQPEDGSTHQLQGLVLYEEKPDRAKKHFAKAAALSTRSLVGMSPLELSEVPL